MNWRLLMETPAIKRTALQASSTCQAAAALSYTTGCDCTCSSASLPVEMPVSLSHQQQLGATSAQLLAFLLTVKQLQAELARAQALSKVGSVIQALSATVACCSHPLASAANFQKLIAQACHHCCQDQRWVLSAQPVAQPRMLSELSPLTQSHKPMLQL